MVLLAGVRLAAAVEHSGPRVVWSRGEIAYLECSAPDTLLVGDRLVFVARGDTLALGTVERSDSGGLARAKLGFGGLSVAIAFDRIDVHVLRPGLPTLSSLTIGCPAIDRASSLFACGSGTIAGRLPSAGYTLRGRKPSTQLFVRDSSGVASAWPESLTIWSFRDAADEEIALERGWIDVALFWPGELSTRLRESKRWQGFRYGARSRGVIVGVASGETSPAESASVDPLASRSYTNVFEQINEIVFRGDLGIWGMPASNAGHDERVVSPGQLVIRAERPPGCSLDSRLDNPFQYSAIHFHRLRLYTLEAPIAAADSVALAVAEHEFAARRSDVRAGVDSLGHFLSREAAAGRAPDASTAATALSRTLGVAGVLTIRCPVLSAPHYAPYLDALGPNALADLIGRLPPAAPR